MGMGGNKWLSAWYIPGDVNTSDGLTICLSSVNSVNLLDGHMFRTAPEEMGNGSEENTCF